MEEKRLILALAISIGFFALWSWMFPPPRPEPVETTDPPGVAETARPAATPADPEDMGTPPTMVGFPDGSGGGSRAVILPEGAIAADFEEEITVDTPLQSIRFSNRGARVTSWRLQRYADEHGEPLDLVSAAAPKLDLLPLQILVQDATATTRLKDALYRVERREESNDAGATVTIVSFTYSDAAGLSASKTVRIPHDSYISELDVAVEVGGRPAEPTIVWGAGFGMHTRETSGGHGRFATGAQGVVRIGDRVDRRLEGKIKPDEPWIEAGSISWAGLEDKYFAALVIPQSSAPGQIRVQSMRLVEEGREDFYLSFALQQPGASSFRLFVGPKDYDLLKGLGYELDSLLDFGFFSIIALPLFYALKFVEGYTGNYGWAIIILTIGIRLVFFPFMHRGQLKMRRMQDKMKKVNPKVKAMKERYRKLERKEVEKGKVGARQQIRQKMNNEMMALYKEENINPLGSMSGCLPLLVQMPILYGFYTLLTIAIELRLAPFMFWITDLSIKDPYFVTPIVMGGTMLIQQMMTAGSIPDPAQRRIMYIMPIMFTYFFINLPSGLVLYWLVNNILGIGQQYLINKEATATQKAG